MMRRTPLKRGTKPLRRTTRLRARGNTAYRRRDRDVPRMLFVKRLPCILRTLPLAPFVADPARAQLVAETATPCTGRVEADHQGARGMSQKADDSTVVPMCASHHQQRHQHNGAFKHVNRDELRAWRADAIARTQAEWGSHAQDQV